MKKSIKTIALITTCAALTGLQSLYACSGCGCRPKPVDEKKPCCKAALLKGTACQPCAPKKDATCATGVCSLSAAPMAARAVDHNINTFQMKAYVDSGKAVILDARSGKYDDGFRIPGAKSLNDKSTAAEISAVIPTKDALVVTYCSNLKCPASKRLADHLKKLGYTQVYEYPEGIAGWRAAGGEVTGVN